MFHLISPSDAISLQFAHGVFRIFQTIHFYSINQHVENENKTTLKAVLRWSSVFMVTVEIFNKIRGNGGDPS